ncbi:DNA-protecting protein DprA [Panacibacter ginsenosidivorans]|uniref:DNA-protecting protein DprA n=1 Tax=Panacibacter ginsenosidivorans TaxID=1813871 RepID=A0A5B8V6M9_9BACT|nr:DNA-processing protein DprA [Panacibacter ginsenosidivorans]QEC66942.1 DNA-protecting protein DprA [Panacibacter ginsenosidivorans]
MPNDLLYQIALTLVPNIGAVQAKILVDHFGDAESIFKASLKKLNAVENIGEVRSESIKAFDNFEKAQEEIDFIEKYKIQPIFITDTNYPQRLLKCYDAPALLYYRGNADLNHTKIISIIGTRNNTDYGKQVTEKLVADLADENVLVLSGLAFGIDAIAHKAALQNNLPTVGVLAHGLDTIYPSHHKGLAKEMLQQGGLLTEFIKQTKPDKHNFPKRNRIVAGMADATIVVETAIKGGSMITAELAHNYNRDVFALPGKTTDSKSAGCNYLIKQKHATLLTDAQQLIEMLGWQKKKAKAKAQKELFIDLSADERVIVDLLKERDSVHIDELFIKSGLSSSAIAASMLSLELQNVLISLPGKMYRLA